MFSHVTLGTNDVEKALKFYDAVLGTLGIERFHTGDWGAGYGTMQGAQTWVMNPYDGQDARSGNGVHIAYLASSRAAVDEFHQVALANGATDEGAPGLRQHYHPNYYGCYVRDLDGNKLQAVCHTPE